MADPTDIVHISLRGDCSIRVFTNWLVLFFFFWFGEGGGGHAPPFGSLALQEEGKNKT